MISFQYRLHASVGLICLNVYKNKMQAQQNPAPNCNTVPLKQVLNLVEKLGVHIINSRPL